MIVIQLLLIVGFLGLLAYFFKHQGSYQMKAWSKILMVLFTLVAIYVIAFPDSSNALAHSVGVARGADLLLYILTLSFVFVLLNLYISRKREDRRVVALTRRVAILEAEIRNKQKERGKIS